MKEMTLFVMSLAEIILISFKTGPGNYCPGDKSLLEQGQE